MKFLVAVALHYFAVVSVHGEGWKAPWFCHHNECPAYTLIQKYGSEDQGFEERVYNASRWITTGIDSTSKNDVATGFWKLHHYIHGENTEEMEIPMKTAPVVIEVEGTEEINASIWFFVPPDATDLPEPNDSSIKERVMLSGTVYVRSFGGMASGADAIENVQKLKKDLVAEGKQFDPNRYEAAGYDAPWTLLWRHNEVWVHAV